MMSFDDFERGFLVAAILAGSVAGRFIQTIQQLVHSVWIYYSKYWYFKCTSEFLESLNLKTSKFLQFNIKLELKKGFWSKTSWGENNRSNFLFNIMIGFFFCISCAQDR